MKQHRVHLSNGCVLLIEERNGGVHIATESYDMPGDVDMYICEITRSGVLVMPNSADAVIDLTTGLTDPPGGTPSDHRRALLQIGAQHPAWSANPSDKLVDVFNRVTAQAREAVGAVGADDHAKADWCARESPDL